MSTVDDTRRGARFEEVHANLVNTIIEVVGQEFYEECEVDLGSTFAEDIELESMEMMEIADRMITTYEGKVDFVAWFAGMELEQIIELTVGQVVDFIVASLDAYDANGGQLPTPAAAPAGGGEAVGG
jgi:acyl carrier protein